ncbi:MerR family transcriptional regulator [Microbacterium sp. NE2HP2]|uniref:transcriptional regulator FtsR n=1 Tax=Microbacterium TaxID=33882 RepID=UPI0023664661|nr:MerR family transcriptional regulator [Microbacterium plantarum]MDD7943273.1 MerR family transcriptional regulator [Microbacterium plantarum]WRK18428.1 MerR family transcriptional regulator [Microbacterium plantarum]
MSAAPAARSRSTTAGHLSIGQVLARLSPEFPALSSSKLRYLEDQGIVTPTRTGSGYRKFSPADVERLRTALTLQRDHYMPLARIREYLDTPGVEGLPPALPASIVQHRRYRRDELIDQAEATAALLGDAVSAGLLPAADTYDERALVLLRTLVALDRHGIGPRHLRTVRQAAERDVALVETALAPLLRRTDSSSRGRAHELAPELVRRLDDVRSAFVQAAIDRLVR